ncbi:hypothetical protein BABINDRAFT_161985 [Babjeviella inositovora NRRL Y-12698]|uniref:Vacuolar-sorting protein SNF7 n=1 Tax=Babjeviella inositovora NRRL Y-12698 TaxID=984486 RepID=A0A1E3QPH6_9ASCO|nr:uncharacterized protein BABINDRAFT_161985 [Babjeviella inositovora NRRL Y-12698]ODQ79603.1 hypothetical protein BABINDRAFT_161985 [Babjeviella inositovora NRRL Y-12698]
MWNYIFGGNSQTKKEMPKKAIVDLREHISMLNKKQSHLENQIGEQDALARKNITVNKNVAKAALKRKKVYEGQLDKIQAQIDSLDTQLNAIESANLNLETMKAMKQGAKAMKQIHGDFDVDKVDATMDDIREQVELSEEISEAISRPLGQEIDDDELEDELAALQEEAENSRAEKVPAKASEPERRMPSLPDVPVAELDEDEAALRALQEEMGL